MANTNAIWQRAAHTTYCHLLAAQQEAYKKAYPQQKIFEFSGEKKPQENQPLAEK